MRVDESVAYYWTSLALSAVGVVVFLWLLAPPRRRKTDTSTATPVAPPSSAGVRSETDQSGPTDRADS